MLVVTHSSTGVQVQESLISVLLAIYHFLVPYYLCYSLFNMALESYSLRIGMNVHH